MAQTMKRCLTAKASFRSTSGINIIDVDGSSIVRHEKAEELGMNHCLITVDGGLHVPHLYS